MDTDSLSDFSESLVQDILKSRFKTTSTVHPKATIFIFLPNQNHLHGTRLEVYVGNSCGFCHENIYFEPRREHIGHILFILHYKI